MVCRSASPAPVGAPFSLQRRALGLVTVLIVVASMGASLQRAVAAEAAPATDWDLSDLYPNAQAWTAEYQRVEGIARGLEQYKGTLAGGPEAMARVLVAISDTQRASQRLYTYAKLRGDEDLRVAPAQEQVQKAQALQTIIDEKTAWLGPEVLALGSAKVEAALAASAQLQQRFNVQLHDILRRGPHTLGAEAESVLAAGGNVFAQPDNVFQQLADAELPFPTLTLPGAGAVHLDGAAYTKWRSSTKRDERKQVFDSFWGTWKAYQGTFGANLTTQVMTEIYLARARHFDTAIEAALFSDNMPPTVYRSLVAQANAALPTFHRYLRLRKRVLGITDDLAYYDNYPPLFAAPPNARFDVAESERLTLAALAPMGEEYLALLRKGFAGKWMNVLPHQGKAGGAYMSGSAYDVHPYLLLNHNDDYLSLSTLAHEWGHAVHTLLANGAQPYEKASYSTFIAESASIGNEMLLEDYMVKHARNRAEKLYYLGEGLESIRQKFFRQVMFAEFQLAIHEELEQGRALSGQRISDLYCGLLRRYYGEAEGAMKIDPVYCSEWEFIPHFYYGFYVYQYATSMAGAAQFTQAILEGGSTARTRFLDLLKAGGSDYPYDLYKRAGIDMASPQPYQALVARMNRLMDEIETLERTP